MYKKKRILSYTYPNVVLNLYYLSSSQKEILKCIKLDFLMCFCCASMYSDHYIVALKIDNAAFANYAPKLWNTQPIEGSQFAQYF